MFALSFTGPERVELVDRRAPRIVDDADVIVRMTTTAIGPRDLARYAGYVPSSDTIPGAEFCGIVDEVGGDVSAIDLGDLVTVLGVFDVSETAKERLGFGWNGLDGGQALFVRVPDANNSLIKVPTAAIEERALLLGDTYGLGASAAAEAIEALRDDTSQVCVIGCDPYGASALIALGASGTDGMIALDDEERRLGLAHRLGGTTFNTSDKNVADAVRETTGGDGPGAVIVGAGVDSSQVELGLRLVQPGGTVVMTEPDLPGWQFPEFANERGIKIRAAAPPSRADVSKAMLDLWGGTLELGPLVSHVMPLIDAERGYAQLHTRERGAHKILLKM